VKFFVQNTDIPILLDSMTLELYSFSDDINFNYYVENIKINPGTTLDQFSKSVFRYNIPQQAIDNSDWALTINYKWSTRFLTNTYKTSSSTTNGTIQNIVLSNFKDKIIVTNGIFVRLDTYEYIGQPVLYPTRKLDKFLISKKSFGVDSDPTKIRLFAIKKNSTISTPPSVKNYDGKMIPFSESNNYYYFYFYPMTTAQYDLKTIFNDLIFYKNADMMKTPSLNISGGNFLFNSRVCIMEYGTSPNGLRTEYSTFF